jgi:hypothetical protein
MGQSEGCRPHDGKRRRCAQLWWRAAGDDRHALPIPKGFCRNGARGVKVDDGDEIGHDHGYGAVNFNNEVFVLELDDGVALSIRTFNFAPTEDEATRGVARKRHDFAAENLARSAIK